MFGSPSEQSRQAREQGGQGAKGRAPVSKQASNGARKQRQASSRQPASTDLAIGKRVWTALKGPRGSVAQDWREHSGERGVDTRAVVAIQRMCRGFLQVTLQFLAGLEGSHQGIIRESYGSHKAIIRES